MYDIEECSKKFYFLHVAIQFSSTIFYILKKPFYFVLGIAKFSNCSAGGDS